MDKESEEFPLEEIIYKNESAPQSGLINSNNGDVPNQDLQKLLKHKIRKSNQLQIRPGPLIKRTSFPTGIDLNAMSVASLYDKDDETKEMDTDKDFLLANVEQKIPVTDVMEEYELNDRITLDSNDTSPEKYYKSNGNSNVYAQPNPFDNNKKLSNTLYLTDGKRSIDFVLVWKKHIESKTIEETRHKKREIFETNLENEGLELEMDVVENNICFVKIHAPIEVLRRYSEILKLRMPMKEQPIQTTRVKSFVNTLRGFSSKIADKILVDERNFPAKPVRFTAVYSRDKEYLFDLSQTTFFTAAIRSRIVRFILDRKRFSNNQYDYYAFGIDRLITEEVYEAAYPLHDGEIHSVGSMRNLLFTEWAAVSKWYRYQPLDYIKEYFGVKIGLYFAWLGYYTYMLMLASVVGLGCFIYSWATINNNKPSQDVCNTDRIIKMCPLCDDWCDYWDLAETCFHAKITYLFDNPTTVFFAIFMSFWATLFLELWKRYSSEITHRWDLTGFDIHEEHPRPEYLARLTHVQQRHVNVITNQLEPEVPFWRMKLPATIFSFSIVLLLVAVAIAAVLGVVLYRMSILAALTVYGDAVTTSKALLFTTATAAVINLCLIFVFNYIYTSLAEYLTELELLRTQTEFDDSLTLKIYLLQFINYYASIFYIAFFKGKFVGYPGNYNRFFGYRQEECGLGGCLMELCIQLSIIMIGKQAMNTILEMLLPKLQKYWNTIKNRIGREKSQTCGGQRWWRDLKLVEWGPRSLFPEYLEMVLQYGFVTIFVAAFPLAPLFALLNNMLEMRLDAKKLLTFYRRPVTQRVRDIGVWYRILDSIGKLSVITNGFIIAFTSDFIPRIVYQMGVSDNGTLDGYLEFSLSHFDTRHLQNGSEPRKPMVNVSICRYSDFREPKPNDEGVYPKTAMYWNILAARLIFIVIFENVVALVMIVVRWCIPDMSHELRDQIRREAYITNEIIIKQETIRATRARSMVIDEIPSVRLIRMEHLMNPSLSGSQLDLVIHGEDDPIAPGHCKPNQYRNQNQAFLEVERGEKPNDDDNENMGPISV